MKATELKKHATCSLCRNPILSSGLPLFWRVTIEHLAVDIGAVNRQYGLGTMLGSHALAATMGPDEDVAKPIVDQTQITVCQHCSLASELPVMVLAEIGRAHNRRAAAGRAGGANWLGG